MKFKPIEPNRGDFITSIPDNMIQWAKKNNIVVRGTNWIVSCFYQLHMKTI